MSPEVQPAPLPPLAIRLFDGRNLAILTTLNPDGSPHSTPVWAMRDGDDVLISSVATRRKTRNVERDSRVSLVVVDPATSTSYVSVNGLASVAVDNGRTVLQRLSMKYLGGPYPHEESFGTVRVVLRVCPHRVTVGGDV